MRNKKEYLKEMYSFAEEGIQNKPSFEPVIEAVERICSNHRGNINELIVYRENVPTLIQFIADIAKYNFGLEFVNGLATMPNVNKNRRWSKTDDELLIDLVCNDMEIKNISSVFHRSPTAIAARISHLVGVKRLSQKVAGKFIGTADGEEAEFQLEGTLYKR